MWIIAGLVLGGWLGLGIDGWDGVIGGALAGTILGVIIQIVRSRRGARKEDLERLEARVAVLEQAVAQLKGGVAPAVSVAASAESMARVEAVEPFHATEAPDPDLGNAPVPEPEPAHVRELPDFTPAPDEPRPPGTLEQAYMRVRAWLLGGNTVVRVGLLVLFFGLAFLARYAVEHSLVPIEFRLAGIVAGGVALLAVGWRLRHSRSGYALSMQGGGVAVLYLTIFATMRIYQLIPPGFGFALLLAVVAFSAVLALLQNAQALAVIGIAGGFMAPILASTGQGSHVMLFSYYLLLNAGLLAMAWKKAWRVLNLTGFLFTFSIALAWGARDYRPELFASTEPFLVAFVLMYIAAAVLYAWRSAPSLKHYVDGTLVFGTPVVGFGLQAALVRDMPYGLAWSALALGGLYLLLARWLHGCARPTLRLLVESFLALGVAFATLTIPLALDGQWTAAAWAMEGAALLWVGVRQSRKLAMFSGLALQLAAGLFFIDGGGLSVHGRVWPLFNSQMLGALLVALAGFASSRIAERGRDHWPRLLKVASPALLLWATLWWLAGGMNELDAWLSNRQLVAAALALFAFSGALATEVARRLDWRAMHWPALLALPGMALSLLMTLLHGTHPLAGWGVVAWPLALASALFALRQGERAPMPLKGLDHVHTALLWLTAIALAWGIGHVVDGLIPGASWANGAVLMVAVLVLAGLRRLAARDVWPVGPWRQAYVKAGGGGVVIVALLWALAVSLASGGDVSPLPYLPLLNPLDLAMVLVLLASVRWCQSLVDGASAWRDGVLKVLALLGFVLANGALLRADHHLAGVAWDGSAMFNSGVVQASLSLFWGLLGLALTFVASRGQRRTLWMLGAVLLGVVVAKLFIVELASTGTVARIVSFIGAGVVLLVVGYFSPLPPAKEQKA
ncbi:MAG: DUF2339 domain-containing protein [Rhodocyclales bacterium]|nr:DUF2339 domain-containing protein [Rhodocyclales bacterium]